MLNQPPCRFDSYPRECIADSAGCRNWQTGRRKTLVVLARDYRSRLIMRRMPSQVLRATLMRCWFDSSRARLQRSTKGLWSKGKTLGDTTDSQLKRRKSASRFVPTLVVARLIILRDAHSAVPDGDSGAAPFSPALWR